jgi:hypothetical protein
LSDQDDDISESDKAAFASATAATPQDKWNADCNRVFYDGVKRFGGEFEDAVEQLKTEGVATQDVLLQVLETDDPAKMLYELARDKDVAKTVAKLNPVQRASAIAALQRGEPLPTRNPLPAYKQSRSDIYNDSLSNAEFDRAWTKRYGSPNAMPGRRR